MTVQKLVNKFNEQFEGYTRYQSQREEKLKNFHKQFKAEEKKIRRKLDKQPDKIIRRKLKKKLSIVKQAYVMLDS